MAISNKPRYNLNLIVQETGLKADTIRAWERRYHLPLPARSDGGHRLYSDHDLSTIKWLLARQKEGMRISQAVNYWEDLVNSGIDPLIDKHQLRPADTLVQIDENDDTLESLQKKWIEYCIEFDEPHADQVLSLAFAQFSLETAFSSVILPSLNQIGQLWYAGAATVQQEHFMSEIAIKKIQTLITAAPNPVHTKRILIGCPPDEQHTIAILMLTLLLKHRGWDVLYLGANVPIYQLGQMIENVKPDLVIMNSSRLYTSASMLRMLNLVLKNHIPAAFGGEVFNQIPNLAAGLPGTYLGNDLQKSITIIEDLVKRHIPRENNDPHPPQDQELVKLLNKIRPELDNVIWATLPPTQIPYNTIEIYEANQNLIQDISAALTLGDLSYLKYNLDWLSGLISTRKFKDESLTGYLITFSTALADILGPQANQIITWFENNIYTNNGAVKHE